MSRPQKIKNGMRLSVVLSEKQVDRIKYMAIRMSAQTGRQITVSEAIRMAVEVAYPVPKGKQMDIFDD